MYDGSTPAYASSADQHDDPMTWRINISNRKTTYIHSKSLEQAQRRTTLFNVNYHTWQHILRLSKNELSNLGYQYTIYHTILCRTMRYT